MMSVEFPLFWDDSHEIALELQRLHSVIPMEDISLEMIFEWTISLPRFQDDPEITNDDILQSIYIDWYEEVISNE